MEKFRYLKGVTTLELNPKTCVGCGTCELVCPHAVWQVSDKKARMVDRDGCMECGACAQNCPVEAISVNAGVGCAAAIITGTLSGTAPCCGPSESCESSKACC